MRSTVLLILVLTGMIRAEEPTRFQWKSGSTIVTKVEQQINVAQTSRDPETQELVSSASVSKINLTKEWTVKSIDAAGVATLMLRITAFKQEIARPAGLDADGKPTIEKIIIDSSTAEGKEQTASYLNKPIVTVQLDPRGQVIEAKSELGSVSQLKAELPFRVTLPASPLKLDTAWTRDFTIQLDPPLGAGEKYAAKQNCNVESIKDGNAVIATSMALDTKPESRSELASLAPMLWSGTVTIDIAQGQFISAKLKVKQTIDDYQGEGTKLIYESDYAETVK